MILKHYNRNPFDRSGVSVPIFNLPPAISLPPLRIISFANFSFSPQQATDWAGCLAQRDIHYLGLDGIADTVCPLLDCVAGSIHTLNSLAIRISDGTDSDIAPHVNSSLDRLLSQNPALTSLAAYDISTDVLGSVTRHHGGHLHYLRFRRTRSGGIRGSGNRDIPAARYYSSATVSWDNECIFSPDDLRNLSRQLPALKRLGIDLSFKYGMASCSSITESYKYANGVHSHTTSLPPLHHSPVFSP